MSYDTMTLDELQAEFVRLGSQLVTISNTREALLRIMADRKAAAVAKAAVAGMSVLEKDALRVELGGADPNAALTAAVAAA